MKFSNIIYAVAAFCGLGLLASCDVNDEFYDELDKDKGFQLVENLEYTLTDDDYEDIGGDPKKYGSFSKYDAAADHLPEFLGDKYFTLDENSSVKVTYKFYQGSLGYLKDYLDYLEELSEITSHNLSTADYDSMGTNNNEPGQYNNFSGSTPPEDYLPDFLLGKYPDAIEGDEIAVTYKYYDGSVSEITGFWAFDGSIWAESEKVAPEIPEDVTLYELVSDDYDSMGAPGKYNNFSSSVAPEDYLATFLGIKFAYATEGEKIVTIYKYYAGGGVTETKAKEYTLTDGVWMEYSSTINKTDPYLKTANGWLFDPTVLYTMVEDDYQMIVDYVKANIGTEYVDSYGTADSYYGTSAYYKEFNISEGDYDESFATWQDAVKEAVSVYLPLRFPDAVAQVEGVDVNYLITFAGYESSMVDYTITFKCTKSGPSPEFEYVEGPTLK